MNEKMIEEMAKVIIQASCKGSECETCAFTQITEAAVGEITATCFCLKALYNAGYRKIPEGSVVLDRQEHQKYCAYKIIEPQIKGCLDRERELEKQVVELEEQRDRQAYIAEELNAEKKELNEEIDTFNHLCNEWVKINNKHIKENQHLKAENEELKNQLENKNKETAKEILTKMLANAKRLKEQFNSTTYGKNKEHLIATIEIEIAGIKNLAKKYGVEVEE